MSITPAAAKPITLKEIELFENSPELMLLIEKISSTKDSVDSQMMDFLGNDQDNAHASDIKCTALWRLLKDPSPSSLKVPNFVEKVRTSATKTLSFLKRYENKIPAERKLYSTHIKLVTIKPLQI